MKRTTTPRETGSWLRRNLESSGPAYIKFGQFVGNRPDIFGREISEEVSKLQNQTRATFKISKPKDIYRMDEEPIASASIAQVYAGSLRDGRKIAVKIKKPNVDQELKGELDGISSVLNFSRMFIGEFSLLTDWFGDFEKTVSDELDFMKEVTNIQFFHEIYKYTDQIRVPRVVPELSDSQKIVMEYVSSEPIKTSKNPVGIANNLMNTFVEQILYHGVIHGDLHAGNLGISGDTIVMYDFGNVIRIPEFYQKAMRDVLVACQNRDSEMLLKAMTDMKMNIKDRKAAKMFTKKFFVYLDTLDPKSFSYTKDDIMVPIELDTITLTILRTYSLVEGLCKDIYPQFTYEQVVQENMELLVIEQLVKRFSPTYQTPF